MATLILEHSDLARSDHLGLLLRDHGHRLDVRRLHAGDPLPTDLDNIDAIVTCGGPQLPDGSGGEDWIDAECDLLRAAHESDRAVIGLCLGSQLLGRALGGRVEPLDGGIEMGWHDVDLTPAGRDDPAFAGIGWTTTQLHYHRWHLAEAPPEAVVLAKSERTPIQAWRLGHRTYGIQFHPESTVERLGQWIDDEPAALDEAGTTREAVEAATAEHWPTMARLAQHLFERMALCVMPLDRRFAGIAKDIHH